MPIPTTAPSSSSLIEHRQRAPLIHHGDGDQQPRGDRQRQLRASRCRRASPTPTATRSRARPSPSRSSPAPPARARASSAVHRARPPTRTASPPHRRSSPTAFPDGSPRPPPPPASRPSPPTPSTTTPTTTALQLTSTHDPSATVDSRYRSSLQARLLDANGQPIEGATVTFAITAADNGAAANFLGGTSQATALTDANGLATAPPLIANKTAGTFTATATAPGAQPGQYTLENLAAAPTGITAGAANGQSTTVGTRFPIPLAVTVTDKNGNPVAGATRHLHRSGEGGKRTLHGSAPAARDARTTDACAYEPHRSRPDEQQGHRGRAAVHRQRVGRRLRRHRHRQRQLGANGLLAPEPAARMSASADVESPRLRLSDLARIASVGLRTRRMRAALSALGIAIGVAAIVAVLGLSSSSQAGLLAQIDKLGTNLLTVQNGQTLFGQTAELPLAAPGMISRIGPVQQVQYTGSTSANVYRSRLIPSVNTNALSVQAASLGLPPTVGATVAAGEISQRGHRARAGRRARLCGRAAPRDRPALPGRAHLAGRDVVLPRRHPQLRHPRPRDRLVRPRRLPGRGALPRLRRPPDHRSTSAR